MLVLLAGQFPLGASVVAAGGGVLSTDGAEVEGGKVGAVEDGR